jgi:chromosome segregation ATPase
VNTSLHTRYVSIISHPS